MKTAFPRFTNVVTIRLYSNIPFDNTYKHHSLISKGFTYNSLAIMGGAVDSVTAKERFIDRKNWAVLGTPYYYPRYDMTGEYNFDFSNGLVCSVTLELTPEQTNANYMRVKVGKDGSGYDYYYYFITSISQLNADTYKLGLELDVLMTYQDEFLEGIHNVPVFTSRKHCHRFTDDGLMPFSTDLKTGDDTFAGVKPSILTKIYELSYKTSGLNAIKDVVWLYICVDRGDIEDTSVSGFTNFTCNDIDYPFILFAIPINVTSFTIKKSDNTTFITKTSSDIRKLITEVLIGNGSVHGCKISSHPPVSSGLTIDSSGNLTLKAGSQTVATADTLSVMDFSVSGNSFLSISGNLPAGFELKGTLNLLLSGFFSIYDMYVIDFDLDAPADFNSKFINADAPTPTDSRFGDPKLLFSPFKKYELNAPYSVNGCEIYPELMFSEYVTDDETDYFKFGLVSSPYIADYSIFTYLKPVTFGTEYAFNEYKINKIGLAGTMNYTIPVGENALDVFNSTQASTFYQSKTASGITGGLSIAGGIGSVALGVAGLLPSMGMSAPMSAGLIAGGVTAMASGIASVANTVRSTTAKIEDLKNTPDSINIAGSNFLTDDALKGTTHHRLPYIVEYDISSVIKQNAEDYFYNYGYQVARECYFNTALDYSATNHTDDNNLLGRTIFNYIQLNDDIVNKINYNMPQIIKQKLSNIFNNGITLWSWFGLQELWAETPTDPTSTYYLDRWFMKCELDNTEYNILIENQ